MKKLTEDLKRILKQIQEEELKATKVEMRECYIEADMMTTTIEFEFGENRGKLEYHTKEVQ